MKPGIGGLGHIFMSSSTFTGGFSSSKAQGHSDFGEEMTSSILTKLEPASQLRRRATVRSPWRKVDVTTRVSPLFSVVPFLGNSTSNFESVLSGMVADSMHPVFSPQGHTR